MYGLKIRYNCKKKLAIMISIQDAKRQEYSMAL